MARSKAQARRRKGGGAAAGLKDTGSDVSSPTAHKKKQEHKAKRLEKQQQQEQLALQLFPGIENAHGFVNFLNSLNKETRDSLTQKDRTLIRQQIKRQKDRNNNHNHHNHQEDAESNDGQTFAAVKQESDKKKRAKTKGSNSNNPIESLFQSPDQSQQRETPKSSNKKKKTTPSKSSSHSEGTSKRDNTPTINNKNKSKKSPFKAAAAAASSTIGPIRSPPRPVPTTVTNQYNIRAGYVVAPTAKFNNKSPSPSKPTKRQRVFAPSFPPIAVVQASVPWMSCYQPYSSTTSRNDSVEGEEDKLTTQNNTKRAIPADHIQIADSALQQLDGELEALASYVRLSPEEQQVRHLVVEEMNRLAEQTKFDPPDDPQQHIRFDRPTDYHDETLTSLATMKPNLRIFGSFATQSVCNYRSDVDLALFGVVPPSQPTLAAAAAASMGNPHDNDDDDTAVSSVQHAATNSSDEGGSSSHNSCSSKENHIKKKQQQQQKEQVMKEKIQRWRDALSNVVGQEQGDENVVAAPFPNDKHGHGDDENDGGATGDATAPCVFVIDRGDGANTANTITDSSNITNDNGGDNMKNEEQPVDPSKAGGDDKNKTENINENAKTAKLSDLHGAAVAAVAVDTTVVMLSPPPLHPKKGEDPSGCGGNTHQVVQESRTTMTLQEKESESQQSRTTTTAVSANDTTLCSSSVRQRANAQAAASSEDKMNNDTRSAGMDKKVSALEAATASKVKNALDDADEKGIALFVSSEVSTAAILDQKNNKKRTFSEMLSVPGLPPIAMNYEDGKGLGEHEDSETNGVASFDQNSRSEDVVDDGDDDDDSADKLESCSRAVNNNNNSKRKVSSTEVYGGQEIIELDNHSADEIGFEEEKKEKGVLYDDLDNLYGVNHNADVVDDDYEARVSSFDPIKDSEFEELGVSFFADKRAAVQSPQSQGPQGAVRDKVIAALRKLKNKISKAKFVKNTTFIRTARVPIIKIQTCYGFEADIAVGGHNGTDTSHFAARQAERFPQSFATVVLALKILLAQHGLDVPFSGGLGSFKLYVLVAYHLEQHLEQGGSDRPGEVFLGFLFRYGLVNSSGSVKYPKALKQAETELSQDNPLHCDGNAADLHNVFRVDDCVKLFRLCWEVIVDRIRKVSKRVSKASKTGRAQSSSSAPPSMLVSLVDPRPLQEERQRHWDDCNRSRAFTRQSLKQPPQQRRQGQPPQRNSRNVARHSNQDYSSYQPPPPRHGHDTRPRGDRSAEQLMAGYGFTAATAMHPQMREMQSLSSQRTPPQKRRRQFR